MIRTPLMVPVDGQALAADRWDGPAPLVVLLHAGIADRRSWYEVAERVSRVAGVVACDRRGFGESAPPAAPFRHLDDLLAVLDQVSPGAPVWLVGSSVGGRLAVDAAQAHPERVAGLVLLAPAVRGAPPPDQLDESTQRLSDLLDAAEAAGDLDEINRLEIRLWLDGPTGPEGRVAGPARDLAMAMNAVVLRLDVQETPRAEDREPWSALDRLPMPVVLAWGDLDVPFFLERCRALADAIPHARRRVLAGTAHLPSLEVPAQVADLVIEALRSG